MKECEVDTEIGRSLKTDDLNDCTSRLHVTQAVSGQNLAAQSLGMSMNFDRRRINGPEDSFSPMFVDDDEDDAKWCPGKPRQSRLPHDIRPICGLFQSSGGLTGLTDLSVRSSSTWSDQPSEWLGLHRNRADENCVCGVRAWHDYPSAEGDRLKSVLQVWPPPIEKHRLQ